MSFFIGHDQDKLVLHDLEIAGMIKMYLFNESFCNMYTK